ncbi:MAG: FkbM family methyltransferase [Planctomycetaceae bacterium]|nr:FkbM family methyltransferase [Planctomycetaceae bacterium]MCA9083676.1 FkbM family methyltransferase [Planctomycetaceae bacterium]
MFKNVTKKYRAEGLRGVARATVRKLLRHREPEKPPVSAALAALLEGDHFCVVQIGAYIGDTYNDPLFETLSRGLHRGNGKLVAVEPVSQYFQQLQRSYVGVPHVFCENVAIAAHSGPATFYRLGVDPEEHGYPAWLCQLGSLKRERMEKLWNNYEGNPDYQEFYLKHRIAEEVNCLTFADLLKRHQLAGVDLLQIDVEGFESEILSSIDFKSTPVRFVNYECVLLQEQKWNVERMMAGNGFRCMDYGQDTFCWTAEDDHLIDSWRRSLPIRTSVA